MYTKPQVVRRHVGCNHFVAMEDHQTDGAPYLLALSRALNNNFAQPGQTENDVLQLANFRFGRDRQNCDTVRVAAARADVTHVGSILMR